MLFRSMRAEFAPISTCPEASTPAMASPPVARTKSTGRMRVPIGMRQPFGCCINTVSPREYAVMGNVAYRAGYAFAPALVAAAMMAFDSEGVSEIDFEMVITGTSVDVWIESSARARVHPSGVTRDATRTQRMIRPYRATSPR